MHRLPYVKAGKPHGPAQDTVVKNLAERNHTGTLTLAGQAASGLRHCPHM